MDFAVTSGIRRDRIVRATMMPEALITEYEAYKRTHGDTASECTRQGFQFTPFVVEAHGGAWSLTARRLLSFVASQQAAAGEWAREGLPLRAAQRISCVIHTLNARAVLRRLAQPKWVAAPEDLEQEGGWSDED